MIYGWSFSPGNEIPLAVAFVFFAGEVETQGHLGAVTRTALRFGVTPTEVSKWKAPKEKKGCGGDLPHSMKPKALELAHKERWPITAADIVLGRWVVPQDWKRSA